MKAKITVDVGRWSKISITVCACMLCLTLLMMIQININTRGTDNGDMEFLPHIGGRLWKMSAVCVEKALSLGKRCQILLDPTECYSVAHCLVSFHIKPV